MRRSGTKSPLRLPPRWPRPRGCRAPGGGRRREAGRDAGPVSAGAGRLAPRRSPGKIISAKSLRCGFRAAGGTQQIGMPFSALVSKLVCDHGAARAWPTLFSDNQGRRGKGRDAFPTRLAPGVQVTVLAEVELMLGRLCTDAAGAGHYFVKCPSAEISIWPQLLELPLHLPGTLHRLRLIVKARPPPARGAGAPAAVLYERFVLRFEEAASPSAARLRPPPCPLPRGCRAPGGGGRREAASFIHKGSVRHVEGGAARLAPGRGGGRRGRP
jgi:hypothetical protein